MFWRVQPAEQSNARLGESAGGGKLETETPVPLLVLRVEGVVVLGRSVNEEV